MRIALAVLCFGLTGAAVLLYVRSDRARERLDRQTSRIERIESLLGAEEEEPAKGLHDHLMSHGHDRKARTALLNELQKSLQEEARERARVEWTEREFPPPEVLQPAHEGKVQAVKAESSICVISLGAADGVEKGFQYIVSRGAKYVATIEITEVEASSAGGRPIEDLSRDDIRPGDRVVNGR